MSIPIHTRYEVVTHAHLELTTAVGKIIQERELTYAEVTSILAQEILAWNKYAIRAERHPNDPEKKGDEA